MKKILFLILALLMAVNLHATPDSTMSISSVSDADTIEASEHNTARSTISSTYNAHSHTDIVTLNSLTSATSLASIGTITTGTWTGTTIAVANGGTGSTTASTARTALGVAIGTDVQAYDAQLDDLADGSLSGAGTVNVSAITGTLGTANGGTGATANSNSANGVVILNGSTQLPAISGALLTNLPLKSVLSSVNTVAATSLTYSMGTVNNATEENVSIVMPFACTLKNFNVRINNTDAGSITSTIYVNGSASILEVVHATTETGTKTDTDSVSISAGDRVSFASNNGRASIVFRFSVEIDIL